MGLLLNPQIRLVTKSLRLDFVRTFWVIFLCLVPPEEILSPPSESLNSLKNLRPLDEVICSLTDDTISSSEEALNILFVLPRGATNIFVMKSNLKNNFLKGQQGSSP